MRKLYRKYDINIFIQVYNIEYFNCFNNLKKISDHIFSFVIPWYILYLYVFRQARLIWNKLKVKVHWIYAFEINYHFQVNNIKDI